MSEGKSPLLNFEAHGKVTVGTINQSSVLSAFNVAEFGVEVLRYINEHPKLNLLLNFEQVDYLSSAVLTELLKINRGIESVGGKLRLCAISPVIQEIFDITNLDKVFTIYQDSCQTGIKRFLRALEIEEQEAAWENG
ncbi:MAG: STAS domain-containing protein [Candidatus Hydrogenedentes bacterium]|nr:STAS domain-containing protein [Candidatus Hydrogenedentota bacterium]